MTVRRRLLLWNTGIVALTLIALGIAVRFSVQRDLHSVVDNELLRELQTFQALNKRMTERDKSREASTTDEIKNLEKEKESIRTKRNDEMREYDKKIEVLRPRDSSTELPEPDTNTQFPRFIDHEGKVINMGRPRNLPLLEPWDPAPITKARLGKTLYSTVKVNGESLRLCTGLVGTRDKKPVVGQFAFRLTDIERGTAAVDRTLLTLLPLSLLLTSGIGAFLTRKAIQPIEDALASERDALASERESLARQKRFVADASHELKTPLAIIKAAAGLGLDTATGPAQKTLERIDSAANRTNRIVSDLMLLAQSDNDQIAPQKVEVSAPAFLAETVALFNERRANRVITVETSPDLTIQADSHQLSRAVSNLLDNAIRHTKENGTIVLKAEQEGPVVVITLTDDGEGIAPEHLPHLFERFYRVDSARARKDGGTGLGLAITRSLIEAQGGTLQLTSQPGLGTTIIIHLPG